MWGSWVGENEGLGDFDGIMEFFGINGLGEGKVSHGDTEFAKNGIVVLVDDSVISVPPFEIFFGRRGIVGGITEFSEWGGEGFAQRAEEGEAEVGAETLQKGLRQRIGLMGLVGPIRHCLLSYTSPKSPKSYCL
jgi:hypothetical protein